MFTETFGQHLEDMDVAVENQTETKLEADTISVETEKDGDEYEVVKATIKHEDGGFSGTFRIPLNDIDSEEALASVLFDQWNYWNEN